MNLGTILSYLLWSQRDVLCRNLHSILCMFHVIIVRAGFDVGHVFLQGVLIVITFG